MLEAAHKVVALHALNGRWPGVDGQRRRRPRRHAPQRRAAASRSLQVDMRAVRRADLEAAEAAVRADRRVHDGARHHLRGPAHGSLLADGEAGAGRSPGAHGGRVSPPASASRSRTPPRVVRRTPTPRRAWACLRSTGWDPSAATTMPPGSTSRSIPSCPGPRSSPGSSCRRGGTRSSAAGPRTAGAVDGSGGGRAVLLDASPFVPCMHEGDVWRAAAPRVVRISRPVVMRWCRATRSDRPGAGDPRGAGRASPGCMIGRGRRSSAGDRPPVGHDDRRLRGAGRTRGLSTPGSTAGRCRRGCRRR